MSPIRDNQCFNKSEFTICRRREHSDLGLLQTSEAIREAVFREFVCGLAYDNVIPMRRTPHVHVVLAELDNVSKCIVARFQACGGISCVGPYWYRSQINSSVSDANLPPLTTSVSARKYELAAGAGLLGFLNSRHKTRPFCALV